jgi:hypothetical protein
MEWLKDQPRPSLAQRLLRDLFFFWSLAFLLLFLFAISNSKGTTSFKTKDLSSRVKKRKITFENFSKVFNGRQRKKKSQVFLSVKDLVCKYCVLCVVFWYFCSKKTCSKHCVNNPQNAKYIVPTQTNTH